jgi:hypothetical protein
MPAHQHALGLLDSDPMFQGVLQLLGQPAAGLRGRQGVKEIAQHPSECLHGGHLAVVPQVRSRPVEVEHADRAARQLHRDGQDRPNPCLKQRRRDRRPTPIRPHVPDRHRAAAGKRLQAPPWPKLLLDGFGTLRTLVGATRPTSRSPVESTSINPAPSAANSTTTARSAPLRASSTETDLFVASAVSAPML